MGFWIPLIAGALLSLMVCGALFEWFCAWFNLPTTYRDPYQKNDHGIFDIFAPFALAIGGGLGVLVAWLAGWWTPGT